MNDHPRPLPLLIPLVCGLFVLLLVLFSVAGGRGAAPRAAATVGLGIAAAPLPPAPPDVSAEAYIVRFAGESRAVAERRADKPLAPASLTKVMTAAVAAEKLAPADTAVLSAFAKHVEERKSPAKEGEEFLRDDLIRAALVLSANDAALALAERTGSGGGLTSRERVTSFVQLMNAKARILGMDRTHFENPTGLDMPRHVSTARDLALLAEYVHLRHPALWAAARQQEAMIATVAGKTYAIASTNMLLGEFPGILGGKTGLTDRAKEALMLVYPAGGKTAVIVVLRSDDRFGDGRKILQWLEQHY